MKKIILALVTVASILLTVSCATTEVNGSGIKGKAPKVKIPKRELIAYKGDSLGGEIPMWVKLLNEGQYGQKILAKQMPDLEGKKAFVAIGRGDNLDFVKSWTDLVDIETEVAGAMERVAGKVVQAQMDGDSKSVGNSANLTEVNKTLDMYRASLENVRISGLEKIADYWVQFLVDDKSDKPNTYYEYYSVWAMDKDLFEKQLDKAFESIDETTTEAKELKELVSSKLKDSLQITTNEPEVDDYFDGIWINDLY